MIKLDKANVPQALHGLIPVAEIWGINDDFDREDKLGQATEDELRTLISSIDNVSDEDLYGWLEGPESFSPIPSEEYVSFTCLTMAIESAKAKLKKLVKQRECWTVGRSDRVWPS
jgi:hypothetical protein